MEKKRKSRPARTIQEACCCSSDCEVTICPLRPETWSNPWYLDQPYCWLHKFKDTPLIKRQRQLKSSKPLALFGVALDYDYLIETAPKL